MRKLVAIILLKDYVPLLIFQPISKIINQISKLLTNYQNNQPVIKIIGLKNHNFWGVNFEMNC